MTTTTINYKSAPYDANEQPAEVSIRYGDPELDSGIRSAVFGEMVKRSQGIERYHSDLFHDATWLQTYLTEPCTFFWAVRDYGTILDSVSPFWLSTADFYRTYEVTVERDDRSRWTVTFNRIVLR